MDEDAKVSWEKALFAALNRAPESDAPKILHASSTTTTYPNLNNRRGPHDTLQTLSHRTSTERSTTTATAAGVPSGLSCHKPLAMSLFDIATDSSDSDLDHPTNSVQQGSSPGKDDANKTSKPRVALQVASRHQGVPRLGVADNSQNERMNVVNSRAAPASTWRETGAWLGARKNGVDVDSETDSCCSTTPAAVEGASAATFDGSDRQASLALKSGHHDNEDRTNRDHHVGSGRNSKQFRNGKGKGKRRRRNRYEYREKSTAREDGDDRGGFGGSNSSWSSCRSSECSWNNAASDWCRPRGSAVKRKRHDGAEVVSATMGSMSVGEKTISGSRTDVVSPKKTGRGVGTVVTSMSRVRKRFEGCRSDDDVGTGKGTRRRWDDVNSRRHVNVAREGSGGNDSSEGAEGGDDRKPTRVDKANGGEQVKFDSSDDEEEEREEELLDSKVDSIVTGKSYDESDNNTNSSSKFSAKYPRGMTSGRGRAQEIERDNKSEDDDLDEEANLKPTIAEPPFLDPVMMPLGLENEDGSQVADVPAATNRYLRDFQKAGVKFMWNRIRAPCKPKGVILADDMGLGKTVQIMALLSALLKKTGTNQDLKDIKARVRKGENVSAAGRPVLIVSPSSVVQSWEKHLNDWGHFASASIVSGRRSIERVKDKLNSRRLEVVCVGYDLFTSRVDTLAGYDWLMVVFDEVHMLKNPKSKRSEAVETLKSAEVFVGLTGTLIQNDLSEFWWLMNVIEPGCLKTADEFSEHFKTPILLGGRKGASRSDVLRKKTRLDELGIIRDKMVLRRNKEDELGDLLKGKTGIVVFCELSPVQAEIYQTVLSLPEFKLLAIANDPCPCGRGENSAKCCGMWPADDTSPDGVHPDAVLWRKFHEDLEVCRPSKVARCPYCCCLPALTKLQKVANHPSLLQVDTSQRDEKLLGEQIAFAELSFTANARGTMAERDYTDGGGEDGGFVGGGRCARTVGGDWDRRLARSSNFLQLCRDDLCGKMKTLKVLLKRFRRPIQKVLLFSYSTAMLDILQALMMSEGYTWLRLDGSTPVEDRARIIRQYNKGDRLDNFVFLLSTRAGGTGLNLQSANKVILYDVNWNPTQDTQAEDRAYRIGQTGKVEVYRLVSTGTIEEMTYMRQISKLQTSAATMGDKAEGGLRQFEGVQGVRSQQGELWGIGNLMRYSGESMLLKLRAKHSVLPPIIPENDGLVMEREQNVIDVVNRATETKSTANGQGATAAATGTPNTSAIVTSTTMVGENTERRREPEGEEAVEEEEGEAEFDTYVVGQPTAARGVNLSDGKGNHDCARGNVDDDDEDDLGGVAMPHNEMVAAHQEDELPEASQATLEVVQVLDKGEDEDDDDEGNTNIDDVNGPLNGNASDAQALSAGIYESLITAAAAAAAVATPGANLIPRTHTAAYAEESARFSPGQPSHASASTPMVSQELERNDSPERSAGQTAQEVAPDKGNIRSEVDASLVLQGACSSGASGALAAAAKTAGQGARGSTAEQGQSVSYVNQEVDVVVSGGGRRRDEEDPEEKEDDHGVAARIPGWASAATQQGELLVNSGSSDNVGVARSPSGSNSADVATLVDSCERPRLERGISMQVSSLEGSPSPGGAMGDAVPSWGWAQEPNGVQSSSEEKDKMQGENDTQDEMQEDNELEEDVEEGFTQKDDAEDSHVLSHPALSDASERTQVALPQDVDVFAMETQVETDFEPA